MINSLLYDLQTICEPLLPVLGALALVYFCILLRHLWKLVDEVAGKVHKLDTTIDGVNQSLVKVQAPLDTVVRISHSMDKVQDKTEEVFTKASQWVNDNLHKTKEAVEETDIVRQPGEEETVSADDARVQQEQSASALQAEEEIKEKGEQA